eukprot:241884-Prymnesium_polylepis.1
MSISRYGGIDRTGSSPVQVPAWRGSASLSRALHVWPRCVLIARSALLRCQRTFAGTTRREAHDPVIRSDLFSMMTSAFDAPSSTDRPCSPIRSGLLRTATSDGAS